MGRLDHIALKDLHELKAQTEGETPRERVLAAIGRKQGDTIDRLAERHDVTEKTIRNWLDRFVDRPLEDAPYDEHRPGRPPKLSDEQREQLFEELRLQPSELGYNCRAWTTSLVAHHIEATYGVEYTDRNIRYLMNGAGLSWRNGPPGHADVDPTGETEF